VILFSVIITITKKEYLIKFFERIEPYRSIVTGFLALLKSPLCTQDDIDKIFALLEEHIKDIQDKDIKAKVQNLIDFMKELQAKENVSKEQDAKDMERLIEMLNQI